MKINKKSTAIQEIETRLFWWYKTLLDVSVIGVTIFKQLIV
jgi:hypothetical protein